MTRMTRKLPDPGTLYATDHTGLVDEELTRQVIGGYYYVYNTMGYGFVESVYARALYIQLHNWLRASNLTLGLLFRFGPRPTFNRVISEQKPSRNPAVSAQSASSQFPEKARRRSDASERATD